MGAREKDLNPDVYIGLKLPLTKSRTGFFKQTKTTLEQAKYNIKNLLLTIPGERLGQPTFGSNLHKLLFEPMDSDFEEIIESNIQKAIEKWLPYISIKDISFDYTQGLNNQINISIDFSLSFEPDRFGSIVINAEQFESSIPTIT